MVELMLRLESPFRYEGETVKVGVKRGETVHFKGQLIGDPTAPDMEATIVLSVGYADFNDGFPAPDPMTDFKRPVMRLDHEAIDLKEDFTFPRGATFDLDVYIEITKGAKWFNSLKIGVDPQPIAWRPERNTQ